MVGTNLCVGVIGMYHSGIGGGGFMLVRDKHGQYESLDYRESAPAAAHRDMYNDTEYGSTKGGLAVGVPGELKGLEYLHTKYGVGDPTRFILLLPSVTWLTHPIGSALERGRSAGRPCCTRRISRYAHRCINEMPDRQRRWQMTDSLRVVTEDLVRYMNATVFNNPDPFLINDPVWAEDFAPNGKKTQHLPAMLLG